MPKVLIRRDENGDVKIPKEFLDDAETVFSLERQGKAIRLEPGHVSHSLWETASKEEWLEAFNNWVKKNSGSYGLSPADISRDSIYD
jgi:hypothetical protein